MTAMSDLVLATLDQLVARALTGQPARTDGKPLNPNVVYSQLPTARMVDPRDFANPWSPMGGSTLQDEAASHGVTPADPDAPADAAAAAPTDAKYRRAMSAAFRTSEMVDTLLMVTKDGSYRTYAGGGRRFSFTYENIINAMQPVPAPPVPAELQARIDAARAVLYELDDDGEILGPSDRYRRYQKNARAYAQAKADFATQQALILADPARADIWPMLAAPLQQSVDDAWDNFKTAGTEKVEQALDTIESVGQSLGARMIARSRELLEGWKLNIAGVPTQTLYSYVDPTRWYDAEEDIGWTRFTVTESEAHTHTQSNTNSWASSYYRNHAQSTGGGGGVSLGFLNFGGVGRQLVLRVLVGQLVRVDVEHPVPQRRQRPHHRDRVGPGRRRPARRDPRPVPHAELVHGRPARALHQRRHRGRPGRPRRAADAHDPVAVPGDPQRQDHGHPVEPGRPDPEAALHRRRRPRRVEQRPREGLGRLQLRVHLDRRLGGP